MADTDLFVENFKAKLGQGGARSNLFKVTMTGAENYGIDLEASSFLCKASSLPGSTVAAIDVPFRGRVIKIGGDRTFEQWTVTVINELDFEIRNGFEVWMDERLNSHETNYVSTQEPSYYKTDMQIEQLSKSGAVIKTYKIKGAFPTAIAPVEVSFESTNQIEEFDITFDYDYWTSDTTT